MRRSASPGRSYSPGRSNYSRVNNRTNVIIGRGGGYRGGGWTYFGGYPAYGLGLSVELLGGITLGSIQPCDRTNRD